MNFFNKMNIKQKLILNFSLTAICVSITFLVSGYFVNSMGNLLTTLFQHPFEVSNAAGDVYGGVYKMHRDLRTILISEDLSDKQKWSRQIEDTEANVYKSLDLIKEKILGEEGKVLEKELRALFENWKPLRNEIEKYSMNSENPKAIDFSMDQGTEYVDKIEKKSLEIKKYAFNKAFTFLDLGQKTQQKSLLLLVAIFIGSFAVIFLLFIFTIKSVMQSISSLKEGMLEGVNTGIFNPIAIEGNNEIVQMSKAYNLLIRRINDQLWLKDGEGNLNESISGDLTIAEFTQKTTSFLSTYLSGGSAVFYLYDVERKELTLKGSYAFTERDSSNAIFTLGQGTIGQVALERQPILQKNIKRGEAIITTGLFSETPLNTFAFPLIYEDLLLGVIEIASFEPFDFIKQEFIKEVSDSISTNLFALVQSEKIKELLKDTQISKELAEKANEELNRRAVEMVRINTEMEEQQQLLQVQAEELQQSNVQMEEQQQLLQAQAEELQQTNTQLEEQQQILGEQSETVKEKNHRLIVIQNELKKRAMELEESNAYKSQFLANMSHELRTPLNSIILLSKLLANNKENHLGEKEVEKVEVINKAGNELLRLINDILDLSKLEAGKIQINNTVFHTSDLVQDINEIFSALAEEKQIEFVCEDLLHLNLNSDKERISQIIRNFLSNSFKFTEKGTVTLKIMNSEKAEYPLAISVIDTGIGIPKEKQEKIFEAFEQVDGSTSRKYGGTGLGLYIVKEISTLLKGKIEIESTEGLGSKFTLLLPIQVDNTEKDKIEESAASIKKIALDVKCILLVEDDELQRKVVKEFIENDTLTIVEASSEGEAKALIETHTFQGAIVDLQLKSGDGLGVCHYIKEQGLDIPIVIYTGREVTLDLQTEIRIKKYADSIVIKTANSLDRLQDELFVLLYERSSREVKNSYLYNKLQNIKLDGIKSKNIMIVDDDPKNIYVLATALEECEATIIQAENGMEALEKLKTTTVDLILMDIMMPVMDGYQCIKRIRENEKFRDIPIIALTAKALKGDKEKCIEAGANDYISKPIDYGVLLNLINAWTNK